MKKNAIFLGALILISITFFIYYNKQTFPNNSKNMNEVYTEQILKEIMNSRTQKLVGVTANLTDPFGERKAALLIKIEGQNDLVPVYIINRNLWNADLLNKSITFDGSNFEQVIERNGATGAEDFAYYTIEDINSDLDKAN